MGNVLLLDFSYLLALKLNVLDIFFQSYLKTAEAADGKVGCGRAGSVLAAGRASCSLPVTGHMHRDKASWSPDRKSQARKNVELCIPAAYGLEKGEVSLSAVLLLQQEPGYQFPLPGQGAAEISGARTAMPQHWGFNGQGTSLVLEA